VLTWRFCIYFFPCSHGCYGARYVIFVKWGTTGEHAINQNVKSFGSKDAAVTHFGKNFKDKTGNHFSAVLSFKKKPYKYDIVDLTMADEPDVSPEPASSLASSASAAAASVASASVGMDIEDTDQLVPEVDSLIRALFDSKALQSTMTSLGLNNAELPLGRINLATVKAAYSVLTEIDEVLKSKKKLGAQIVKIKTAALSKKYACAMLYFASMLVGF